MWPLGRRPRPTWSSPIHRDGLGAQAVQRLAATGAARLVLVSCDPAALGRDAGLLAKAGFELERAVLVDLFPHTHHIEAVATFLR